jgi:hypothetical protein
MLPTEQFDSIFFASFLSGQISLEPGPNETWKLAPELLDTNHARGVLGRTGTTTHPWRRSSRGVQDDGQQAAVLSAWVKFQDGWSNACGLDFAARWSSRPRYAALDSAKCPPREFFYSALSYTAPAGAYKIDFGAVNRRFFSAWAI